MESKRPSGTASRVASQSSSSFLWLRLCGALGGGTVVGNFLSFAPMRLFSGVLERAEMGPKMRDTSPLNMVAAAARSAKRQVSHAADSIVCVRMGSGNVIILGAQGVMYAMSRRLIATMDDAVGESHKILKFRRFKLVRSKMNKGAPLLSLSLRAPPMAGVRSMYIPFKHAPHHQGRK